MMACSRLVIAAVVALALAGCSKVSSKYCAMNPDDARCAMTDASAPACTSDPDCTSPTPVCQLVTSTCVQCDGTAKADECTATTPVCGDNNRCRGCTAHTECPSATCLPDGQCADEDEVAYVQGGATATEPCSRTTPCGTLDDALDTARPIIKLSGAISDDQLTIIDGRAVTLVADPGTTLDRDGDGTILVDRSASANVHVVGLQLSGATGAAPAIKLSTNGGAPSLTVTGAIITANQGSGIVTDGGVLTVTRSTISFNQGGGISVTGTSGSFDLTNNFIYRNGNPDSGAYGGLSITVTVAAASRLEFNTIVDNRASTGATRSGGVICDIVGFSAPNNIIARNVLGTSTTLLNSQTLGTCTYPTSLIQPDITGLDFTSADTGPYGYKLEAASAAIDQATTASLVVLDHDGEARPAGAQKDIGADEYVP